MTAPAEPPSGLPPIATVGYEGATVAGFLRALRAADVDLLIDVRALAVSRRPGFAKTRLAANLAEAGIAYQHLRALGTPADGRAAARAGRHADMRAVFAAHLATPGAQEALAGLADLVRAGRRVCLLCLEADPAHCHRALVAAALAERLPADVVHLDPAAHGARPVQPGPFPAPRRARRRASVLPNPQFRGHTRWPTTARTNSSRAAPTPSACASSPRSTAG